MIEKNRVNQPGCDELVRAIVDFAFEGMDRSAASLCLKSEDDVPLARTHRRFGAAFAGACLRPSWHPTEIVNNLEFPWEC